MQRLLFILAVCCAFDCKVEGARDSVDPYGSYLAQGIDVGSSVENVGNAYQNLATTVPSSGAKGNHEVRVTRLQGSLPLRLISFHFINGQVAAVSFSGVVVPSFPNRATLMTDLRTQFLTGYTKQSTSRYRMPSDGVQKEVSVETWSNSAGRKAFVVEREDFAEVVIHDPAKIGPDLLLPFVGKPGVVLRE